MKLLAVYIFFTLSSAIALEHRHMFRFAPESFGVSSSREIIRPRSGSTFSSVRFEDQNIALNYHYRLTNRWQVGTFFQYSNEKFRFESSDSGSRIETSYGEIGLSVLYNFSDKFVDAYFLGGSLSYFNREEEVSTGISEAENKAPFELDDVGYEATLLFGKRFNLKKWGLKTLAYSPSLALYYRHHGKDFRDQKTREGQGFIITPLALDFFL
jgi:hypothetical protein